MYIPFKMHEQYYQKSYEDKSSKISGSNPNWFLGQSSRISERIYIRWFHIALKTIYWLNLHSLIKKNVLQLQKVNPKRYESFPLPPPKKKSIKIFSTLLDSR